MLIAFDIEAGCWWVCWAIWILYLQILGRTGKVLEVDGNGDILTLVEGDKWMLNPAAVTYVTEPEPSQSMGSNDESNEADPLGEKTLFQ